MQDNCVTNSLQRALKSIFIRKSAECARSQMSRAMTTRHVWRLLEPSLSHPGDANQMSVMWSSLAKCFNSTESIQCSTVHHSDVYQCDNVSFGELLCVVVSA